MRSFIFAVTVLVSTFAQAGQTQFSDLSVKQQDRIIAGLKEFLPTYKNALEIALYNIERQSVGTMDVNTQMSDVDLESGTAENMFVKVGNLFDNEISMEGFDEMRGRQTFIQARKEAAQAASLSFHIHAYRWNKKAWMKHMNTQVAVISATETSAAVRLLYFPRANCTITANTAKVVHQNCN